VTLRKVNTVDNQSKVSKNQKTNNYCGNFTWSESTLGVVKPDYDFDDVQFNNKNVVEDTDVIIEKLKTENVEKEKRIQELLRENKNLKAFPCVRRHVKNKSTKFRDKINDIRKRSISSSMTKEIYGHTGRIDSTSVLQDIVSEPIMFRRSLQEAKKGREKKCALREPGEMSGGWQFSEFTLL